MIYFADHHAYICVCVCVCVYAHARVFVSCSVLSDSFYDPMDCSPPGSSVRGDPPGRIMERVAMPSSRDFPNAGIEPRSFALQAESVTAEPPGKPKNIGVGSHPFSGDLPNPGIKPHGVSRTAGRFFTS